VLAETDVPVVAKVGFGWIREIVALLLLFATEGTDFAIGTVGTEGFLGSGAVLSTKTTLGAFSSFLSFFINRVT
jgi:hypothetical protein